MAYSAHDLRYFDGLAFSEVYKCRRSPGPDSSLTTFVLLLHIMAPSTLETAQDDGVVIGLKSLSNVEQRLEIDELLVKHPDVFNLFLLALERLQQDQSKMGYFKIAGIPHAISQFLGFLTNILRNPWSPHRELGQRSRRHEKSWWLLYSRLQSFPNVAPAVSRHDGGNIFIPTMRESYI